MITEERIHNASNKAGMIRQTLNLTENENCENVVNCKDCKFLMFSDFYGECRKGIMGVVAPDDYCSRGEKK